jgi:hypothetical protein
VGSASELTKQIQGNGNDFSEPTFVGQLLSSVFFRKGLKKMPVTSVANTTSPVNVTRQTNAVSDRPTLFPQIAEGISKVQRSLDTLTEFFPSANSLVEADPEISSDILAALSKNTDALTALKLAAQDIFNSFPESAKDRASKSASSRTHGAQEPSEMWFGDIANLLNTTKNQITRGIEQVSEEDVLAFGIQQLERCIKAQQVIQEKLSRSLEPKELPEQSALLELPQLPIDEILAQVEASDKSTFGILSLTCKDMRAQVLARIARDTITTVSSKNLAQKLSVCPNISEITLTDTPSLEQLRCLSGNTNLKSLHFKKAIGLQDAHLEIIGSLPSLEHLNFGSTESNDRIYRAYGQAFQLFTDAGLSHLHALGNLKTLDLGESSKISANGLEDLLKNMPDLVPLDQRQCLKVAIDLMRSPEQAARLKREFAAKLPGF